MRILVFDPPAGRYRNTVRDILYGCWCRGKRIAGAEFPNLDLLRMRSILLREHDILLIDCPKERMGLGPFLERVKGFMPEVAVTHTSSITFDDDSAVLAKVKDACGCKTIVYGSHVTFLPRIALGRRCVDFIIRNDPDFVISGLIDGIRDGSYRSVRGIGYRDGRKIIINEDFPQDGRLDSLPIAGREPILGYGYFNPLVSRSPWTTMLTSRGCLYSCNFCTSKRFYGSTYRANSPGYVLREIRYLTGLGYREIFFRDENLAFDNKRLSEICKRIIAEKIRISWICSSRVDSVDRDLLALMKEAGCHMVRFGVESGSDDILLRIRKGVKVRQIEAAFEACHSVGLDTHAHLMVGCPGETRETIEETLRLIKRIDPSTITCGVFTLLPGTEIFEEMNGASEPDDGSISLDRAHEQGCRSSRYCSLSDEEAGAAVKKVYRSFYLRPGYFVKALRRLRSADDYARLLISGYNVISFIGEKEKK